MVRRFSFCNPVEIVFGPGRLAEVADYVRRWGKRPLVVTHVEVMKETGTLGRLLSLLDAAGLDAQVFDAGQPNPLSIVVDDGAECCRRSQRDVVIGLGGGSAIDVAKAVAVVAASGGSAWDYVGSGDPDHIAPGAALPIVALPTTAGTGTEVTNGAVLTNPETREKAGIMSSFCYPKVSIVDPELALSLPRKVTAATGLDVLFHGIEAYVSTNANPISDAFAEQAIQLAGQSLRVAYGDGSCRKARADMAWASTAGGLAISGAGVTLLHAMGHPVSGHYGVTHGLAMAALFASFFDYTLPAAGAKFARVAGLLGEPVEGLGEEQAALRCKGAMLRLMRDLDVSLSLGELGLHNAAVVSMAQDAVKNMGIFIDLNPVVANQDQVAQIYRHAMRSPQSDE